MTVKRPGSYAGNSPEAGGGPGWRRGSVGEETFQGWGWGLSLDSVGKRQFVEGPELAETHNTYEELYRD